MSPTVRHDPAPSHAPGSGHIGTPRRAHAYACCVLAGALALVVVLVGLGATWPPPGPMLLLALPLALCINRFVFYVNEVGVTADAAVVFAAVVGFRHDAIWLGPVLLALLAGPLDAKHWDERAFVRMAYNSGSSALVATTGIAAFLGATEVLGGSATAVLGAALVAVVPAIAVESVLGVLLVTLQGESVGTAVRHQLPVNTIAAPLAVTGAAAGLLAAPVGWWATALVLAPIAFVPELVLVRLPRHRGATAVGTGAALLATAASAVIAMTADPATVPAVAVVVVLAVLAGLELVVGRRRAASTMVGALVAFVVAVGSAAPVVLLCSAVAGLATAVAWAVDRAVEPPWLALRGVVVAVVAGATSAAVAELVHPPVSVFVTALGAAAWCAGFVVVLDGARRARARQCLWAAPLVVAIAAVGRVSSVGSDAVGVVCGGAVVVAIAVAACFGALPWRSRVLGPWGSRRPTRWRQVALAASGAVALGAAGVAVVGATSGARAAGFVAVAAAEAQVSMALLAVRQWRFAPRPRLVQVSMLAAAAVVGVAAAGTLTAGDAEGAAAIVVVVTIASIVAAPLVDVERRIAQRSPESRNASR